MHEDYLLLAILSEKKKKQCEVEVQKKKKKEKKKDEKKQKKKKWRGRGQKKNKRGEEIYEKKRAKKGGKEEDTGWMGEHPAGRGWGIMGGGRRGSWRVSGEDRDEFRQGLAEERL